MYRYLPVLIVCIALNANGQFYKPLLDPLQKHELSISYNSVFSVWNTVNTEGKKQYGDPYAGYGISLFYTSIINRFFSIQTGMLYHNMGYEVSMEKHRNYELELTNLQIPVMATLNTDKFACFNYSVFVGPQFTYNITSTYVKPISTVALRDTSQVILSVANVDFGIAYGAGADIALNKAKTLRIDMGYRGSLGFTDRSGPESETNQVNIIPENTTINTFGGYVGMKMVF